MEKKYFEAPYLKVVRVNNDIVTTSPSGLNDYEAGDGLVGERSDFDD